MQAPKLLVLIPILIILVIIISNTINKKNRIIKRLQVEKKLSDDLISNIKPSKSLEDNLMDLLGIISSIVEAPSHAFYILDAKSGNFVLRAIRNMVNENGEIGPAYSGLMPYKKESFIIPPTMPKGIFKDNAQIIKEGEVALLMVPVEGGRGMILIGPVKNVSEKLIDLMNILGKKVAPILNALIKTEELKKQVKLVASSERAVKNISNFFSSFRGMIDMVINISMKTIGASSGVFIKEEGNNIELEASVGLDEITEKTLGQDKETQRFFIDLVQGQIIVNIEKGNNDFFKIPPYLAALGMEAFILVNVDIQNGKGIAVFSLDDFGNIKEYQKTAILMLAKRMGDIITNYEKFKELSNSYVDILKMLARLVDNLSPHSVGYSDLMYRYAIIISKELKLSPKEIKDISLAAYLSNIGVIGLSDNILKKKGKYDQTEYEMMKLHSEAGAAIIEATIGNREVASIIRYHHERMDGNGYPDNLKGEEIPIGSKIIAVIQTFLAKILGRNYRDPLSFKIAIEQLRAASNTQLDPQAVEALISWFDRKEAECKYINSSLGPCYEMRCSPERICLSCEAYKAKGRNCWEFATNNCREHGNYCEKCFVYNEYKNRISKKNG